MKTSQQTFLSLLRGHNSYFRYQSIVSLVLFRGHNSYHVYWAIEPIRALGIRLVHTSLVSSISGDPTYYADLIQPQWSHVPVILINQ